MRKALKVEKFELELPEDVVLCLKKSMTPKIDVPEKLKVTLAIGLFTQGAVTLAKAAQFAGMTRYRFTNLLKDYGIPAYEYTQRVYEQDQEFIAHYKELKDGDCR